ncbi:hypothetical protein BJ322DRAFT_543414 [Thelephora terrestris]|uniref:Uncharacterized protein n=1 Tax=Thelephora terrestris TaxID=56493 RepID=A0A9P6HNX7_9AGAM|nr:hypothetical protein BJ322DRAFT_543414 [Thelephora terrestris]
MPAAQPTEVQEEEYHYQTEATSEAIKAATQDFKVIDNQGFPIGYSPPRFADKHHVQESYIDQRVADILDAQSDGTTSGVSEFTPEALDQLQFYEDVMVYYRPIDSSLASEFLNHDTLDEDSEDSPDNDYTMTDDLSPASSSGTSLGTPAEDGTVRLDRPLDSPSFDKENFGTFPDYGSAGMDTASWPWGDHTYRPPTPKDILDPKVCYREGKYEGIVREELSELMAEEAIRDGDRIAKRKEREEMMERKEKKARMETKEGKREGKEKKEGRRERKDKAKTGQPAIMAFNAQAIRGRTIYNVNP